MLKIIHEMGYKPNAASRGLVNKQTHTIGVLLPGVSNRLASALLKGIENSAHRLDYSVIICNTESWFFLFYLDNFIIPITIISKLETFLIYGDL